MEYNEILSRLNAGSDRWCVNYQPPAEDVAEALATLPVVEVEADVDSLYIRFGRPLTGAEGYRLAMLGQDSPDNLCDPIKDINLWWD